MRRVWLLTWLLISSLAWAADNRWSSPSFSIPAKDLLELCGPVQTSNAHGATVLLDDTELKIDSENRVVLRYHGIYRIDTASAIEGWSSVQAYWSPWHQKRPSIRARVISPDGVTQDLDPKTLSDSPARDQRPEVYEDNRVMSGPIPAIKVGSIVEEEETTEDTEPLFKAGIVERVFFGRSAPVKYTRLTVDASSSLPCATPVSYCHRYRSPRRKMAAGSGSSSKMVR